MNVSTPLVGTFEDTRSTSIRRNPGGQVPVRPRPGAYNRAMSAPTRRSLLLTAVMAAASPAASVASQNPEDAVFFIDLPPRTTFWGVVAFFSDDLIEVTVATAKDERRVRGRFKGQRLVEHSWTNGTSQAQRIAVKARAIAANRELPHRNVRYTAGESVIIGFGSRAVPADAQDREGAYPHEAVFVGFVVFGD